MAELTDSTEDVREAVRSRYAEAAESVTADGGASCCGRGTVLSDEEAQVFGASLYGEGERGELPDTATMASLGCGNPTAVAELDAGETVLDLGSGGGIDVLLSARRVDESIDVVISNCVINLSGDKPQVLAEAARVLRPGGRFAVSDVIADEEMDEATRASMAEWTGCIAGALTRREFEQVLLEAGLVDVEITETHRVHDYAGSAIVRARKPS